MRTKGLRRTKRERATRALMILAPLAIGGLTSAFAANPPLPAQFSGLLNDYTPGTTPYEMHGKWTLDLNAARATARFSAEMTMEFADFANPDPTGNHDPTKLGAHTHHISVTDGVIHNDPTGDPINWASSCPNTFSPPIKGGFVITGSANVTGNGANAPFGNPTPVIICVLGGVSSGVAGTASVTYSNMTLTFAAPAPGGKNASTHFGTQAINGVVAKCELAPGLLGAVLPSGACSVAVVPE